MRAGGISVIRSDRGNSARVNNTCATEKRIWMPRRPAGQVLSVGAAIVPYGRDNNYLVVFQYSASHVSLFLRVSGIFRRPD